MRIQIRAIFTFDSAVKSWCRWWMVVKCLHKNEYIAGIIVICERPSFLSPFRLINSSFKLRTIFNTADPERLGPLDKSLF